jgi:hypothetical protein
LMLVTPGVGLGGTEGGVEVEFIEPPHPPRRFARKRGITKIVRTTDAHFLPGLSFQA